MPQLRADREIPLSDRTVMSGELFSVPTEREAHLLVAIGYATREAKVDGQEDQPASPVTAAPEQPAANRRDRYNRRDMRPKE